MLSEISTGGSVVFSPAMELSMTQKPLKPPGLLMAITPISMAVIVARVSTSFLIAFRAPKSRNS